MALKKLFGIFRERIPNSDFHAVHVGSSLSIGGIIKEAKQNPSRNYAIVEPARIEFFYYGLRMLGRGKKKGIYFYRRKIQDFVDYMKRNGRRTGKIVFEMPNITPHMMEQYGFEKLFREARNIMHPGGIISIKSEERPLLRSIANLARESGLAAPEEPAFKSFKEMKKSGERLTEIMWGARLRGYDGIYSIEIAVPQALGTGAKGLNAGQR